MRFDLTQPRKLPLSHGKHVILNTVNGDTHEVDEHLAEIAMMKYFTNEANSGWGQFFDTAELRMEQLNFISAMAKAMSDRSFPSNPNDVLKVGPFVTWDACIHTKNDELLIQAMERFVELGGDLVRPVDRILAAQLRSQENELGEHAGLVMEEIPEKGKINKVSDVMARRRGGLPGGLPPEIAALFGGMGEFTQVAPGVFGMKVDLDDLFDRKKKGDDKKGD